MPVKPLKDRAIVRIVNGEIQSVDFRPGSYPDAIIPGEFKFSIHRDEDNGIARIDFYDARGNHVFACNNEDILIYTQQRGREVIKFPK